MSYFTHELLYTDGIRVACLQTDVPEGDGHHKPISSLYRNLQKLSCFTLTASVSPSLQMDVPDTNICFRNTDTKHEWDTRGSKH